MIEVLQRLFGVARPGILAVVCLGVAVPAAAGIEEGRQAYRDGDFAKAFEEFMPLATAGDVTLQNQIAAMYYTGQGVPQDLGKAAEWFKKAAMAGSADGQYCLGKLYYSGQGIPQSFEDAAKWLTEAGLAGKGGAQYLLATLYLSGKGVSKNPIKAYFWSLLSLAAQDLPAEDKAGATALHAQLQAMLSPRQIESLQTMARNWSPRKSAPPSTVPVPPRRGG